MTKVKCPECKHWDMEEGDDEIDFDKGTYKVKCRCKRCGNWVELFFKKVEVKLL